MNKTKFKDYLSRYHHEYMTWSIIYIPVLIMAIWHAIRLKRGVFFTNVNPSIDMGGFFGEKKTEIYALLPSNSYPKTITISANTDATSAFETIKSFGFSFPFIAKPDVGERGVGVQKINNLSEFESYFSIVDCTTLIQEFITWKEEFGLMFAKDPDSGKTELLSITGKEFLRVMGNGNDSVQTLLSQFYRGKRQIKRLLAYKSDLLASVPEDGEKVLVEPIGNHNRGTAFYDFNHLITPELSQSLDAIMAATNGIYYGRLDVRSESNEALKNGKFTIIELNGVTSEPVHIYDPNYSIWQAWKEFVRHAKYIPIISEKLINKGVEPTSVYDLLVRIEKHFGYNLTTIKTWVKWFSSKSKDPILLKDSL